MKILTLFTKAYVQAYEHDLKTSFKTAKIEIDWLFSRRELTDRLVSVERKISLILGSRLPTDNSST